MPNIPQDKIPDRIGKYVLLDVIGVGGMAEVYRAKSIGAEGFQKIVVLKKIRPNLVNDSFLVQAFIDEARLAAFLEHENIIHIFDFGKMEGDFFIAMEYLFGKNLLSIRQKAREKTSPIDLESSLFIISKICAGLGYAHQLRDFNGSPLNIIHRDISPPNIFITFDGQVKILDFGVAKASMQRSETQYGTIKGHLDYMSPEQAAGWNVDYRSDIFSVGCIMYELFTGVKAFNGQPLQVLQKVKNADFVPPKKINPDLSDPINEIILKAMASHPDNRFQTCDLLLTNIEDIIFNLNLRFSDKRFGKYMKTLFGREIQKEAELLREILSRLGKKSHKGRVVVPETRETRGEKKYIQTRLKEPGKNSSLFNLDRPSLYCPYCSHALRGHYSFCPFCGVEFSGEKTLLMEKKPLAPKKRAEDGEQKVGIIGALGSGKSNLINRFVKKRFFENHLDLAGVYIENCEINYEGEKIKLVLWETTGLDRCHDLDIKILNGMSGYALVVDGLRARTLDTALNAQKNIEQAFGKIPFVCIINKVDQSENWKIDRAMLNDLGKSGWEILRTSAKTGLGVSKAFMALTESIVKYQASRFELKPD